MLEQLTKQLRTGSLDNRATAAKELAQLRDPRTIPDLIACFSDDDYSHSIHDFRHSDLREFLRHAHEALVAIGQPAVKPLLAALSHKDDRERPYIDCTPTESVRFHAIHALQRLLAAGVVQSLPSKPICQLLFDSYQADLMYLESREHLKPGKAYLKDRNRSMRYHHGLICKMAVEVLRAVHDPEANKAIVAWLDRRIVPDDAGIQDALEHELGCLLLEMGDEARAIPLFVRSIHPKTAAQSPLTKMGSTGFDALVGLLQSKMYKPEAAVIALGVMADPRAVEPLLVAARTQYGLIGGDNKLIDTLEKLGWTPTSDEDRAWLAFCRAKQVSRKPLEANPYTWPATCEKEWDAILADAGTAALNPLLTFLRLYYEPMLVVDALRKLGDARALGPLVEAINGRTNDMAGRFIWAIETILERAASTATPNDLALCAGLHSVVRTSSCLDEDNHVDTNSEAVDCSKVIDLARQELNRRGLREGLDYQIPIPKVDSQVPKPKVDSQVPKPKPVPPVAELTVTPMRASRKPWWKFW